MCVQIRVHVGKNIEKENTKLDFFKREGEAFG